MAIIRYITRVHGGIVNEQIMKGTLRFYEMVLAGAFKYTDSDGTVLLQNIPTYGGTSNVVGNGKSVSRSAAEIAFQVIQTKATITMIRILDDDTIQFAIENETNAWDTTTLGGDSTSDADNNMQSALRALGTINVPSNLITGQNVNFSTITVVEKDFELV